MGRHLSADAEALWRDCEEAIETGRSEPRVMPLLLRLARMAPHGSDAWLYALRHLAERVVKEDAWRAALLSRRMVEARPDDDGGWAILGLAQSLMGHHRYAVRAYRRALSLAPDNPWYAHNLGHLYDVALGRPDKAVPLLARALGELRALAAITQSDMTRALDEVAASYAHALLHTGDPAAARRVMRGVMRGGAKPEHHALYLEILRCEDEQVARTEAPSQHRRVKRRVRL